MTVGLSSSSLSAATLLFLPLGFFSFGVGFEELDDLVGLVELDGLGIVSPIGSLSFEELVNHDGLGDLGGFTLALAFATAIAFFAHFCAALSSAF